MAIPFRAEMEYEYNWLKQYVCNGNDAFTSALMGNFYAESHCYPIALQPNHFNDAEAIAYTDDVNNGTITRTSFATDQKGYGLAQWTASDRKYLLYDYWQTRVNSHPSIGELQLQLLFVDYEFRTSSDYYRYETLKITTDINTCSDIICDYYENPKIHNYEDRRGYSQEFYDQYAGQPTAEYRIYTISDNDGGAVYASSSYANAGDTVYLYHTEVAGVTFQNFSSSDVTIIGNSFIMPASDVTVYGHFTGSPTPTTGYPINIVTNKRSWITAPQTAEAGEVVYIIILPFAKRKILSVESADVTLSETVAGYSFYMPANEVTIKIKFKVRNKLLVAKNPQLLYQERRNSLW